MPFEITTTVECLWSPDDGAAAKALDLQHLKDELMANTTVKNPIYMYLEYSQSTGKVETPEVPKLIDGGVQVTIGASPVGSQFIGHIKGIV